jgi:hypothetical protein
LTSHRSYLHAKPKSKILFGDQEPIFSKLPHSVLANLRRPASENALLWNLIYPLAQPTISLERLLSIPPLWGTVKVDLQDEPLEPYYWGYHTTGERLPELDDVLTRIDGEGPRTEVDLFLLGSCNLFAIEAKHLSGLGHCSRFAHGRCPEIHANDSQDETACRYWEPGEHAFQRLIDFGERPDLGGPPPPCYRHYQLGRTLLVGDTLAREHNLDFGLWLFVPRKGWRSTQKTWLDFVDRIRDDRLWRRLRVMAWEDLRNLGVS